MILIAAAFPTSMTTTTPLLIEPAFYPRSDKYQQASLLSSDHGPPITFHFLSPQVRHQHPQPPRHFCWQGPQVTLRRLQPTRWRNHLADQDLWHPARWLDRQSRRGPRLGSDRLRARSQPAGDHCPKRAEAGDRKTWGKYVAQRRSAFFPIPLEGSVRK